jgi:hypothetical protein
VSGVYLLGLDLWLCAQRAFPMYLSTTPKAEFGTIVESAEDGTTASSGVALPSGDAEGGTECECCLLTLTDNPLGRWVELPEGFEDLWFSNVLCGVLRGALGAVQYRVRAEFVSDVLKGGATTAVRVVFKGMIKAVIADEYHDE